MINMYLDFLNNGDNDEKEAAMGSILLYMYETDSILVQKSFDNPHYDLVPREDFNKSDYDIAWEIYEGHMRAVTN